MRFKNLTPFKTGNQVMFASGSMAFNMLERMLLLYIAYFYLLTDVDEAEGMHVLFENPIWSFVTVFGIIMTVGRIFDALADPLVAQLSDNNTSKLGRRKLFMIIGGLPLALSAILAYYPPEIGAPAMINAIWLALMVSVFYFAFTAFVNPYLALISELGQTESIRINMSTFIAAFGLVGMVLVMVIFPLVVGAFQNSGYELRQSYQFSALIFGSIGLVFAYISLFSFDEKKHALPSKPTGLGIWESLKMTYSIGHYRIFLAGEVLVYFCVNMLTMGLVYFARVIFKGGVPLAAMLQERGTTFPKALMGDQFMTVAAGAALLVAMFSFPVVNMMAKKVGKKKVLLSGMGLLMLVTLSVFSMSYFGDMEGSSFILGLFLFAIAGVPLAALTTLLFSTLSDIAREDAMRTGKKREGMFYGARAIPLKLSTALSAVAFGYYLDLGRSVTNPFGIQLALLTISIGGLLAMICFSFYPEKDVLDSLRIHEDKLIEEINKGD